MPCIPYHFHGGVLRRRSCPKELYPICLCTLYEKLLRQPRQEDHLIQRASLTAEASAAGLARKRPNPATPPQRLAPVLPNSPAHALAHAPAHAPPHAPPHRTPPRNPEQPRAKRHAISMRKAPTWRAGSSTPPGGAMIRSTDNATAEDRPLCRQRHRFPTA
jgi:hypothetical protein